MRNTNKLLVIALLSLFLLGISADDHGKPFEQICSDYGYPLEKYHVTTEDGYILGLWRIPVGRNQTYIPGRPAVLWQHGGFDSSDALFNHGPDLSPAFYLANQGYDVWLGNARGDKYSRNHTTLNPDTDAAFWDWSFPDRIYDDKANIEFVRQKSGNMKIIFIGHHEGFTTMLTSLTTAEKTWFQNRVSIVVGLAPVARMENLKSTLLRVLGANDLALGLVKLFGVREWFYPNIYTRTLFVNICNYIVDICEFNLSYITDGNPDVNDRAALRVYLGHFPGGLSVKLLDHELQIYRAARFQQYDYGKQGNLEHYGQEIAPLIDLENTGGMPIALMVGTSDLLGDVEDNRWLKRQIAEDLVFYKEYEYGSSSFYIAKDMSYLEDVVRIIRNYH